MAENCNHDCSGCDKDCGERKTDFAEHLNEYSSVKKVIGVVSGKGGVGKSLVTSLLAVSAARKGLKTAILDADITGPSIPKAFGLHDKAYAVDQGIVPVQTATGIDVMSLNLLIDNETDPVVWRGPIIAGTVKQFWTDVIWEDEDVMFIDMPPGTGDVTLTVFQSLPIDGLIIVTSPQELVGMIVEKAVKMANLMNIPVLGMVENMSFVECPNCGEKIYPFGASRLVELAEKYKIRLAASLPIDPKLAEACDRGKIEEFKGDWLDGIVDVIQNL
jgi:Mrp family chromosome partitioning ATPase